MRCIVGGMNKVTQGSSGVVKGDYEVPAVDNSLYVSEEWGRGGSLKPGQAMH